MTAKDMATLTVEERRERRRQKILANADKRLDTILATENRTAPALEDEGKMGMEGPTTAVASGQQSNPSK